MNVKRSRCDQLRLTLNSKYILLIVIVIMMTTLGFGSWLGIFNINSNGTVIAASEELDDPEISTESIDIQAFDLEPDLQITYEITELTPIQVMKKEISVKDKTIGLRTASANSKAGDNQSQRLKPLDESKVEYTINTADFKLTEKDMTALERIVEAEATDEDLMGKVLVANVVLNRTKSSKFPSTVYDVVFQRSGGKIQFSPISDGRYYSVKVTNSTKQAVKRALQGEDYSKGALFFVARSMASQSNMSWFDNKLTKVTKYGVHEFYKY